MAFDLNIYARYGGGFVGGLVLGAVGGYFMQDGFCSAVDNNKWAIPLVTGMAGAGLGLMIADLI